MLVPRPLLAALLACSTPPPPVVAPEPVVEAAPPPAPEPEWVAKSRTIKPVFGEIIRATLAAKGGTFEPPDFAPIDVGTHAVAVSLEGGVNYPTTLEQGDLYVHLSEFVTDRPVLGQAGNYLGTWVSGKPETVAFDVTRLFTYGDAETRLAALAEANRFGLVNHQKCMFDLGEGQAFAVEAARHGHELHPCPE